MTDNPDELGFCPFDQPEFGQMCPYCTGEACRICDVKGYPPNPPGCQHDSIDRHLWRVRCAQCGCSDENPCRDAQGNVVCTWAAIEDLICSQCKYSGMGALVQVPLFPLMWFDSIELAAANRFLIEWKHRMGPLERPMNGDLAHALVHRNEGPVVVITTSTLIRDGVGGGLGHLNRSNTIELSRLCAARPGLSRLGIRLWREFVFPALGYPCAISYQDADLHSGATYRFDGWGRSPTKAHSGSDSRSGRRGRNKWVWVWPASGVLP